MSLKLFLAAGHVLLCNFPLVLVLVRRVSESESGQRSISLLAVAVGTSCHRLFYTLTPPATASYATAAFYRVVLDQPRCKKALEVIYTTYLYKSV